MTQVSQLWNSVLNLLKDQMSRPSFDTWLKSTTARIEGDQWIIIAPNEFSRDWLESRYLSSIEEAIYSITKEIPNVTVITDSKIAENSLPNSSVDNILHQIQLLSSFQREKLFSIIKERSSWEPRTYTESTTTSLNPKYTFQNFIVGTGNRFAYAASQSVAEAPGKAYNPLFIYSSTGLGKTHLLHAIGNYVLEHNRSAKVLYVTAEQFTNEFIGCIRDNKSPDFRNKYRKVDVLLVDDIQFLFGKEQTQEEFFHTFNHLYENNKQIVLSANCPPKEIKGIIERLMARFSWGLITDIQPHDKETQEKIIQLFCQREQIEIQIPPEVIDFLMEQEFGTVSEILSRIKRIAMYQELNGSPISIEKAKDILHMGEENSNLKDNLTANIEAFTNRQVTQMEKDLEELDKVSILEKEVKKLRDELSGLHTEVKILKMTLANPISKDE